MRPLTLDQKLKLSIIQKGNVHDAMCGTLYVYQTWPDPICEAWTRITRQLAKRGLIERHRSDIKDCFNKKTGTKFTCKITQDGIAELQRIGW